MTRHGFDIISSHLSEFEDDSDPRNLWNWYVVSSNVSFLDSQLIPPRWKYWPDNAGFYTTSRGGEHYSSVDCWVVDSQFARFRKLNGFARSRPGYARLLDNVRIALLVTASPAARIERNRANPISICTTAIANPSTLVDCEFPLPVAGSPLFFSLLYARPGKPRA